MDQPVILDIFSLYEFAMYFTLFVLSVGTLNIYFVILFLALFSKQIPERILKLISSDKINKRPDNAFNCNLINQGGDVSSKSGFPSGHCTISSLIATYLVNVFITAQNKSIKPKILVLMIISVLFAIIMPIVRYLKNCHTIIQVFGGFFIGIIWGICFILFEKYALNKWPMYVKHKHKIWI